MTGLAVGFATLLALAVTPAGAAVADTAMGGAGVPAAVTPNMAGTTEGTCPALDCDILESDSETGDVIWLSGHGGRTAFFPDGSGQAFFLEGGMRQGREGLLNISSRPQHFFAETFAAGTSAQDYHDDGYWQRQGEAADDRTGFYYDETEYRRVDIRDMSVPGARRGVMIAHHEYSAGQYMGNFRGGNGVIIASSSDGRTVDIVERSYQRKNIVENRTDKTPRNEIHSLWAGWHHVVSGLTARSGPVLIVSNGDILETEWHDGYSGYSRFQEGRVAKILSIDRDSSDRLHAVLNLHNLFDLEKPDGKFEVSHKFKFFVHGDGTDMVLIVMHRGFASEKRYGSFTPYTPLTVLALRPEHDEALVWRRVVGRLVLAEDEFLSEDAFPPMMIHDGVLVLWDRPFYAWGPAGQAQLARFPRITFTPQDDGMLTLSHVKPPASCTSMP